MSRIAILTAALLVSAGQAAFAQSQPDPPAQLDYFVSRYHGRAAASGDGLGARLMWAVRAPAPAPRSTLAWAGLYGLYAPGDLADAWRAGAQADAAPVSALRGLPIQPLLSLGAGVVSRPAASSRIPAPQDGPRTDLLLPVSRTRPERETALSLAPGIGARLSIGQGTGIRADLRRIWDFGRSRTASTELSAGVSLPL